MVRKAYYDAGARCRGKKTEQASFMYNLLIKPVIGILLVLLSNIGFAQNDTVDVRELIKLSLEDLINVPVSSASKIGLRINEAPSVVSLITRGQMQKFQWVSLNDIANRQAGFTLGQDRFNKTIVSRGISDLLWSKRLLLLFDGVPFSSFQSSVTDEAFSLNMANSVEVIRGPGAVLYGTQAVTGVMQVNSLSYSEMPGNGAVELKIGDYGIRNINLLTGVKGKTFNTLISFNNFSSNGNEYMSYDAILKRDASGNFIKQRTQDERSSNHFYAKLEGKDKLKGLNFSYHFQNYRFQMGHGFLTAFPGIETTSGVTRNYFMVKYATPTESAKHLKHEYVLKYDHEQTEMNMQIIPSGYVSKVALKDSLGNVKIIPDSTYYNGGVFERYVVPINNLFARTQWIFLPGRKVSLLGGIEQDIVYYRGDKVHVSNINLNAGGGFKHFPGNSLGELEPLYERIKNKPICNTGIYTQFTSGNLLGEKLTATLGLRADIYYYNYKDLTTSQIAKRFLTHYSPRVVLVYAFAENLSTRAMYANAFRVASPFEQFISNSIITGTNQKNIKPEQIHTYELSSDWTIQKRLHLRNTGFFSSFFNQIRSSRGSFTNVLTTRQAGLETEIRYQWDPVSAFANYSYVERIEEISSDTLINTSNTLIWYPSHSINAGLNWAIKRFEIGVQGHYQSSVDRRISEKGHPTAGANKDVDMDLLRGGKVGDWFTADINVLYHVTDKLQIRATGLNIFNRQYSLINNLGGNSPQPFDYQQAGRRIMLALNLNF